MAASLLRRQNHVSPQLNNVRRVDFERKVKIRRVKVTFVHEFCVIRAAQRCADPPGLCVDSPGTLAVRLGAAPLVLQVAWEAELPSRGEGLGLLDNPKSAWSSHAKAAASGKDTRVLNLQNKERRTRDSLSPPLLGHEGAHICAL